MYLYISGPFGYATSRQFNYAKFQNESGGESSPYSKSPKQSTMANETIDLQRSWPLKSSHTKVYRKESNERPLIDLSDEADSGTGDTKSSDTHSHSTSEISSLFDSLLSGNSLQYGNLDLPQPLIRDHHDPFEINLDYRPIIKTEPEVKPKQTPPARPKPIVYRRTSIESQHSSDSWQSFSPPKCTGIKLPPEYRKRENPTPPDSVSIHSTYSVPPQKVENIDRKASVHPVGNSLQTPSSPTKPQTTKAVIEELFAKSRLNGENNKNILRADDTKEAQRSPGALAASQKNKNVDKAFDWLNDALNNFSLKNSGMSGSDPVLAKSKPPVMYDQVPDESEPHSAPFMSGGASQQSYGKGQYPVQYCEVPNEATNHNFYNNHSFPRYDDVPQFDDPSDVKLPIPPKDIYSPHSTASTYSEWDDFDSDFDDDELTVTGSQARETAAPPLPRRDYNSAGHKATNGNNNIHKKEHTPHIFPIVQDGKQLSNTHYFLIPAKGEELVTRDHVERATAAVRPFTIDGNQVGQDGGQTRHDYQNLENLRVLPREMCEDPRSRTSSRENLRRSRSKSSSRSGSNSWSNESVDVSQTYPHLSKQYSRSHSHNSESLAASIDAQRDKITALQEAVIGITDEECHAALCHCQGSVKRAIKHLKAEQLFRLGLAPREVCYRLLEALHWNLELACSTMLDGYKGKVSMESAV